MGEGHTGEPQANQEHLTVAQAAGALVITEGAVRSRIKRGTLPTTKERDGVRPIGRWYVGGVPGGQSELIASLQDQIRYLREQLDAEREARTEERRRHDTVVAQLTSKIPAIEAPTETRDADKPAEEQQGRGEPRPDAGGAQEDVQRPWWRRMFGG